MKVLTHEKQMIQVLEAVSKYGNISVVAQQLFMTQPTVSKLIRNQERQYGVDLIDRTQHPLKLTYAGDYYLTQIKQLVQSYQVMSHEMSQFADNQIGYLTIGVNPSLAQFVLPLLLPSFHRRFPQIKIRLIEQSSAEMEGAVISQKLDLYIGITPTYSPQLGYQRLYTDNGTLILPTASLSPEELPTEPVADISPLVNGRDFIIETDTSGFQRLVNSYLTKYQVTPNIVLRTANIDTAANLTVGGLGATLIPTSALTPLIRQRVQMVNLSPTAFQCDISIAYSTQHPRSNQAQEFIKLAQNEFRSSTEKRD
ncbi:LysR family transcriptional regulator [Secundilactobacillus pentosiphilus]|uniref:LysR family transcriptional regulator n=1 Tax=Secundilactobacillus pentosiphilus TaxID=1714682 RepID=A0A1Z5IRF9_9LACO|nr:LysR family transcriptional regulator [Secundilactobacillus pentosiphilus]GAX04182.1 LysR family transcriptional regulator [Secundilactobacillus pentosiphilus]